MLADRHLDAELFRDHVHGLRRVIALDDLGDLGDRVVNGLAGGDCAAEAAIARLEAYAVGAGELEWGEDAGAEEAGRGRVRFPCYRFGLLGRRSRSCRRRVRAHGAVVVAFFEGFADGDEVAFFGVEGLGGVVEVEGESMRVKAVALSFSETLAETKGLRVEPTWRLDHMARLKGLSA